MAIQPANFGDTVVQGNIQPSVPLQNPVTNDAGTYLAGALNSATTGAGAAVADVFKAAATSQQDKVSNNYRQGLVQLANAVDQGKLSVQAARMRQRTLYSQTIADNPSSAAAIDKLNTTLTSDSGIAHIIETGNEAYQRQQDYEKKAAGDGWMDFATGNVDVAGYQNFQAQSRAAANTLQQLSVRAAVRGESTALEQEQAHQTVLGVARSAVPWVSTQIQNAQTALDKTTDPTQRAQIIQGLQQTVADQVGNWSTASMGEKLDYITKPINDMVNTFIAGATGKVDADVTNQQIARLKAKEDYVLMSRPDIGPLIAASDLFGQGANEVISSQLTAKSAELFGQNLNSYDPTSDSNPKPADVVSSDGDTAGYLKSLQSSMDFTLGNPNVNQDKIGAEVNSQVTNLLRSAGTNSSDNPKDYNSLINFFGSNTMAKWIQSGKVAVPDGVKTKAIQAIQDNYGNVLLPLVEQKWLTTTVPFNSNVQGAVGGGSTGTQTRLPVSQVIDPVWDGSQLTFKPKPQYANNPAVVGTARNMNSGSQSLAVPINTFIKASAHMNNDTDYNAVWKALGNRLFNNTADEGTPSKTDTIGEFNQVTAPTKAAPTPTSASVSDMGNGTVNNYLSRLRQVESGGNDNAANPNSSATGRYQFTDGTWNTLMRRYPNAGLTPDGKTNPAEQETAATLFTIDNARTLEDHNVNVNNGSLYAAHFLGSDAAVGVYHAPDNDPLSEHVKPSVISSNSFLQGMTVGDFKKWAAKTIGG